MRARVGIIDISAAIIVVAVILLPPRGAEVSPLPMSSEQRHALNELQARVALDPEDGEAAELLAEQLVELGQTDWALRAAGAAVRPESATAWMALRGVSTTHAERIEVREAYDFAKRALDACDKSPACPSSERVRLELYNQQLEAGVHSGIDPRDDPKAFQEAVQGAIRVIRTRPPKSGRF